MLNQLKVLRVVRVLRLVKVVRLLRASRLVSRWETRVAINYSAIALIRATLLVFIFLHWSACIWSAQLGFFGGGLDQTWLGVGRYCVREGDEDPEITYPEFPPAGSTLACIDALDTRRWVCRAPLPTYFGALYTVTSVGAVIATRGNSVEQFVAIMLMLAGGTVWAQVTGIFCGVLSTMNPHALDFRLTIDNLNSFMRASNFPNELQYARMKTSTPLSKHACYPRPSTHVCIPRVPQVSNARVFP